MILCYFLVVGFLAKLITAFIIIIVIISVFKRRPSRFYLFYLVLFTYIYIVFSFSFFLSFFLHVFFYLDYYPVLLLLCIFIGFAYLCNYHVNRFIFVRE